MAKKSWGKSKSAGVDGEHVIVVDWTRSDVEATANDLFRFEETTKGHKDVHAHGYEKMAEYLTRIAGEWPKR